MDCTEAYKEHIMYSFNGFCKVVIRYAAINAWRDRNRRQREISFEYLIEEKFYPLSTSDEALKSPYEQYPVTICGQTIILTNGELAAALLSLPEKKREIIYLYFFGNYIQQEIGDLYGHCKSTAWHYIHSALQMLQEEILRHYSRRIRLAALENGHVNTDTEDSIKQRLITALFQFRFD